MNGSCDLFPRRAGRQFWGRPIVTRTASVRVRFHPPAFQTCCAQFRTQRLVQQAHQIPLFPRNITARNQLIRVISHTVSKQVLLGGGTPRALSIKARGKRMFLLSHSTCMIFPMSKKQDRPR